MFMNAIQCTDRVLPQHRGPLCEFRKLQIIHNTGKRSPVILYKISMSGTSA